MRYHFSSPLAYIKAAAHEPIVAQKLAQESGYHSYSTFSTAFKERMQKSVAAWMREEALV